MTVRTSAGLAEEPLGSYRRGIRVQARVLGALLMREIHTRYGRQNIGYLWLFMEPLTLAAAVSLLHAGEKTKYGTDIRMIPFAMLGYSLFIMFRGMVLRAEGALESNMPLFYHRTVTVFDIMFSRAILEGIATFGTYIVLMAFAVLVGLADFPARPLDLFVGTFLMFFFSFALSLLICAGTHMSSLVGRFVHPITYIVMPLSGAFFMNIWMPEPYRTWLTWSPLMNIFEELRYGQFESATNQYVDIPYVVAWCAVLTYFGLVSVKITRRHIHLR